MTLEGLPVAVRVNSPDVIAESVDGEVLIINLVSGTYYNTAGSGAAAWRILAAGVPVAKAIEQLAGHFDIDPEAVAAGVVPWLKELLAEEIVVARETAAEPLEVLESSPVTWAAPTIEKFTDMQDLLILDPVHEVAAEGWPRPANG
jgi:hypothetical protein